MSRFCPLYSSSSANCVYLGNAENGILIDAGASCKSILCERARRSVDIKSIKAIAVTHEHSDHIKGLRVLLKRLSVPVIASKATLERLHEYDAIPEGCEEIEAENGATIGGMVIERFSTSHDCCGSSGYTVTLNDGRRAAVCTDLGYISDEVRTALLGCDLVMLESNHDITMLKNSPYPFPLKKRIMSEQGHLSNAQCATLLPELVRSGTAIFILAHLSRHNNLPTLAQSVARAALIEAGFVEERDYNLYIAPAEGGKMFIL